jgi:hypothetical protein
VRQVGASEPDCRGPLIGWGAITGGGTQQGRVASPRAAADDLIASAVGARWVTLRHDRVVVQAKPVRDPLADVSGHVPKAIRTLSLLPAVYGRHERNLMDVVLAKDC